MTNNQITQEYETEPEEFEPLWLCSYNPTPESPEISAFAEGLPAALRMASYRLGAVFGDVRWVEG